MRVEDKPRFVTAMTWLCKMFPYRDGKGGVTPRRLSEINVDAYFEALQDVSIDALEAGAKWHYGHEEFFPDRPAGLRKSVNAAPKQATLPVYRQPVALLPEQAEANRVNIAEIRAKLQALFTVKTPPRRTLAALQEQKSELLRESVAAPRRRTLEELQQQAKFITENFA